MKHWQTYQNSTTYNTSDCLQKKHEKIILLCAQAGYTDAVNA